MPNIAKLLKKLSRENTGNVTIEFGFVILFMATLGIGAYDFGNLAYQKIAVTNAARAGSQYGAQDMSTAENDVGMKQAARDDINDNAIDPPDADSYYFCPNQTPNVVAVDVLCDDGSFSYFYVWVTVPKDVDLLFPYPFVSSPITVASTNTMRVR